MMMEKKSHRDGGYLPTDSGVCDPIEHPLTVRVTTVGEINE